MDSFKKFIRKHKVSCIVILILFILCLAMFFFFITKKTNDNIYGDRLKEIEKYPISDTTINQMKKDLQANDKVTEVKYVLEGKLINVILFVDPALPKDQAMELGNKVLTYFEDVEKTYYDIQVLISDKSDAKTESIYPLIGYKHKTSDHFVWGNN